MEDWKAIAAEVGEAIRSVSDISQPNGYPVTLRMAGEATGDPWDPQPGASVYRTLYAVEGFQETRDASGTLIGQTRHTLTVNADPDVVPLKSHSVAIGITADEASDSSAWLAVLEVRPLAPTGIAVLYEIDIQT